MPIVHKVVKAVNKKKLKTYCLDGKKHKFRIIKGSGRKTGTSTWKCRLCNHKTKSS